MMREFNIVKPDEALRPVLQDKMDNLNKPKGSLGMLEEVAIRIGMMQQSLTPVLRRPCHLLFGADHGIEREGVSVSPREVTWQQMINFSKGGGCVNMFCRQHGFELMVVDVGVDHDLSGCAGILNCKVGYGTKDFLYEAAMTEGEAERCLDTGVRLVTTCKERGCNVVSIGEMGIGNTSAASVWMHLLSGIEMERCVGAGSGLDEAGIRRKLGILRRAVERSGLEGAGCSCFVERVLCEFGGYELVAAVGAMLRAAELGMTVLVDGFIMTACVLMAARINPSVLSYVVFCHEGDEAGHKVLLREVLHARGLLRLGLRLGEGTGALCAFPLVESAVGLLSGGVNSFAGAHITKYF